jgi:hypothetical protein
LIFQCFLFLLQKWDKFLPLQNQRLMNLTPCDRLPKTIVGVCVGFAEVEIRDQVRQGGGQRDRCRKG